MNSITLFRPAAGKRFSVSFTGQDNLFLSFDPTVGEFSQKASDLVIQFQDGSLIAVEGFFTEGQQLPQSVTLADGQEMLIAAFMESFAPSVDLETAVRLLSSGDTLGGGSGEYADDAGSLIGGVGRLGSFGRLGDFGGETTPELPIFGTTLVAGAGPGGSPNSTAVVPGTPEPLPFSGNFLMTGNIHLPEDRGSPTARAIGNDVNAPIMAAKFPFAEQLASQIAIAGSAWEQHGESSIYVLKTESGGSFVFNRETSYLAYHPGVTKAENEPDTPYNANSDDPLENDGFYFDSFEYIGAEGEAKTVGVLFDGNKAGKSGYPQEVLALLNDQGTSHAGAILPEDAGSPSYDVYSDGKRTQIDLKDAAFIDDNLKQGGFIDYLDKMEDSSEGEYYYSFYRFGDEITVKGFDITGTAEDDVFGGFDEFETATMSMSDSSIDFVAGDNILNVDSLDNSAILMGEGNDSLNAYGISGSSIDMGNGDNVLRIDTSEGVWGDDSTTVKSTITMGGGNDRLVVDQGIYDTNITMGNGDDVLQINLAYGSSVQNSYLDGGGGNDILSIGSGLLTSWSATPSDDNLHFFDQLFEGEGNVVSNFETLHIDLVNQSDDELDVEALLGKVLGKQSEGDFNSLIITGDMSDVLAGYDSLDLRHIGQTQVEGMGDTQFTHYEYQSDGWTVQVYIEMGLAFGIV